MRTERICSGCRDGADFEIPFAMAFQPIVDVETGHAFAYEALVRGVDGAGVGPSAPGRRAPTAGPACGTAGTRGSHGDR